MNITLIAVLLLTLSTAALAEETNITITVDGVTYKDVRWGTVTPEAVSILHRAGAATILLEKLPPDLQQKFGYNPKKASEYHRRTTRPLSTEEIAESTSKLAASKLAEDRANSVGLDLLRIALALHPENRSALLLQGFVKRGIEVPKVENPPLEQTFVEEALRTARTERTEQQRMLLYRLAETVQPNNEDAIISLTRAENSGLDVSLDGLFRLSEEKHRGRTANAVKLANGAENETTLKGMRQIAEEVSLLARYELGQNPESKYGRDLMRVGLALDPDNRTALLLQGLIKRGLAINFEDKLPDLKIFSRRILAVAGMPEAGDRRLLLYKLVEMIEPGNSDAIVTLTAAENEGQDVSLDALLAPQDGSTNRDFSANGDKKDQSRSNGNEIPAPVRERYPPTSKQQQREQQLPPAPGAWKALDWEHDYDKALEKAKKDKKVVMVDVYTDWCGWCKKLDKDVYGDAKVSEKLSKDFIACKINPEKSAQNRKIADKFGTRGYPHIVFVNGDGKKISEIGGYLPAKEFLKQLEKITEKDGDKGSEEQKTTLEELRENQQKAIDDQKRELSKLKKVQQNTRRDALQTEIASLQSDVDSIKAQLNALGVHFSANGVATDYVRGDQKALNAQRSALQKQLSVKQSLLDRRTSDLNQIQRLE